MLSSAPDKFSRHMGIVDYGHVTKGIPDIAYQYFRDELLPLIYVDFGGYGPIAAKLQDGTHGFEQDVLSALVDIVKRVHHYNGCKMDKLGSASIQDGALNVVSDNVPTLTHCGWKGCLQVE